MGVNHNLRHMKPSSYHATTWKWGRLEYSFSPEVHKNFYPTEKHDGYSEPAKLWYRRSWEPDDASSGSSNLIIAYHWVMCTCDCKELKNVERTPTIGSKRLQWYFLGKGSHGVHWEIEWKWYHLKPDEFPFSGLKKW